MGLFELATFRLEYEDDYEHEISVLNTHFRFEGRKCSKCACSELKTSLYSNLKVAIDCVTDTHSDKTTTYALLVDETFARKNSAPLYVIDSILFKLENDKIYCKTSKCLVNRDASTQALRLWSLLGRKIT